MNLEQPPNPIKMRVYRITLEKWAGALVASGYAARWNSNGKFVIYTSWARSLACLENVVHKKGRGLVGLFKTMIIEIPEAVAVETINEDELPKNWQDFDAYLHCQQLGDAWLNSLKSAVLSVPSAIVPQEHNYLLNPQHPDFQKIKLLSAEDFVFDARIKTA